MNEFVIKNGYIAQNNSVVSGSLTVTNGITGGITGTASYASQADTASYALQASSASIAAIAISSSYAATASYAIDATTAATASILKNNSATISSSTSIYTSGSSLLYNLSAFKGAIIDYVVSTSGSGDSIRGGTFTAVWNTVSSSANEVTTVDIGNTDDVQFNADATGSVFVNVTSGSWVVDSLYRALGTAIVAESPVYSFTYGTFNSTNPSLACANGFGGGTGTLYASTNDGSAVTRFFTDSSLTTPFAGEVFEGTIYGYVYMFDYPSGTSYAAYIDGDGYLTGIQECPPPLDYNNYNFGPDRAGTCAGSYGTKSIGVPTGDTIGTASTIYGNFIAMGGAGATFYVKFDNGGTQSTRGFVIGGDLASATPSQPIVAC